MLSLYFALVVFQLGGLHFRQCYRINFIIKLNENLGMQILGQNSYGRFTLDGKAESGERKT